MKNSTLIKGTAAIAVGAALLLGGGGTLANWNAEANQTPGTIVAGDLNVVNATTAGVCLLATVATRALTRGRSSPKWLTPQTVSRQRGDWSASAPDHG